MREIIKKILEVVGSEDVVVIGKENQEGLKTILPEEIELYPGKYKNIIVEDIDQLNEKMMKKLVKITDCLWLLFSIDKAINKIDSTIESMVEKQEFKNITMNEKIETLKKLSGDNALVADFHLSDMAVVIPKTREKILANIETEPLSSFFLNLSMVEYLKSKLEETKREKERLEMELERERIKARTEAEKFMSLNNEFEKMRKDWNEISKQKDIETKRMKNNFEKERKDLDRRFRREVVRSIKEKKMMEERYQKVLGERDVAVAELNTRMESMKNNFEKERIRLQAEIEKLNKEIENKGKEWQKVLKEQEEERKDVERRHEEKMKKVLKENEIIVSEMNNRMEEMKRLFETEKKNTEEEYKEELKKIVSEMGLKLEEREEELKRLKEERKKI
jgi:hypothetical protein